MLTTNDTTNNNIIITIIIISPMFPHKNYVIELQLTTFIEGN